MLERLELKGLWQVQLDEQKKGMPLAFGDTMVLPGTTSYAKKGAKHDERKVNALTDEYAFEGLVWFRRTFEVTKGQSILKPRLFLERTRKTTVWIDGVRLGSCNSLTTPHIYELAAPLGEGEHELIICVDNTDYPTKGGHLTSADTQTNWNGITGLIELQFFAQARLENVQFYPDYKRKVVRICAELLGASGGKLRIAAQATTESEREHRIAPIEALLRHANVDVEVAFGEDALLWSEHAPNLYQVSLELLDDADRVVDRVEQRIGIRGFQADGSKFTINGRKTFLRGKHDGLIFPRTGYAPTTIEEWLEVLQTAKDYGINHYRFHTCCPPQAAFAAADLLGIYMEPELPFWGTIADELTEEQQYLIEEGYRMLRHFGNHPSFVMFSLGNELWGNKARLNEILAAYKSYDPRHLYTQGSNNFQFQPDILEQEDFYCGVRFAEQRLIRGSYAMCDAPLGHVQTDRPSTMKDYDQAIKPTAAVRTADEATEADEQLIQIQYGTEARTVKAEAVTTPLVPHLPVVSHEIGQYAMYPNFAEIAKYTGSIKARNLEVFRERLKEKGMLELAPHFFERSGQLAIACYKEELEAAFRSKELAGFQLLDLQDFPGQGTALVGVLDAFMESKGLIEPQQWQQFCSDIVLLARIETFHYAAGSPFKASIELVDYSAQPLNSVKVGWQLCTQTATIAAGTLEEQAASPTAYTAIGQLCFNMPSVTEMTSMKLKLNIEGTSICNEYSLWVYPQQEQEQERDRIDAPIYREWNEEVISLLEASHAVLLMPDRKRLKHAIEGQYCTDFWNYPMFRSISASMNKPEPVGTLGLSIQKEHPALAHFASESYSTYPWWEIVMNSSSLIIDDLPHELIPIVQTIDNVERNHKLALMLECKVKQGKLLVLAADPQPIASSLEGRHFMNGLQRYVASDQFAPDVEVELEQLNDIFA